MIFEIHKSFVLDKKSKHLTTTLPLTLTEGVTLLTLVCLR